MKRLIPILLAVGMLLTLTACGAKTSEPDKKTVQTLQAESESAFSAEFTDRLYAVSQNYHPGTAGCSLTAAALAAEIMDLFTTYVPSSELIRGCVKEFAEGLTGDAASDYPEQLEAVISASEQINGENGKDLLDSCGYAGTGYPWNAEKMAECFAAMKLS